MTTIELREKDTAKMQQLNAKNKYGLNCEQLHELAKMHQRARALKNTYKMALIEYRLTDINFHSECSMLERGNYAEIFAIEY